MGPPIPEMRLFQTLVHVVEGQGQIVDPVSKRFASFSIHLNQTNNSWDAGFSKFEFEKSMVQDIGEVEGHVEQTIPAIWPIVFDLEKNIYVFLIR